MTPGFRLQATGSRITICVWSRFRSAVVVALVAVSASRVASAADGALPHGSIDFAVGAGYSVGKYTAEGLARPSSESISVAAPTVALTLTPGWAWSTIAVGPMFDATMVAEESYLARETAQPWWILSASFAVRWKPVFEGVGPQGLVALGYASGSAAVTSIAGVGGPLPSYGFESTGGPRLAARYGFVWPSGLGIAATVWGAYLLSEHAKYVPLGLTIQGTVSSW